MSLPTTPKGWAIRLTQILSMVQGSHGLPRFPIDVAALAQDFSRQVFPDAPITIVKGLALDQSVLSRIAALKTMSVKELKTEWERLLGSAAPNNSRAFLEARIAYRLQELTYGGPDHETRRMLDLLADEVEGVSRRKNQIADPRNPVAGTRLIREWNGVEHTITVLKDGFEWQGRKYKSLSGIAREITGVRWNGYRFFGLQVRSREV